jgi:hypothetical protein
MCCHGALFLHAKVYCFLHATHALFLPAHVIYSLPASFAPFLYLIATGVLLTQVLCPCMLKVNCFLHATGGPVHAPYLSSVPTWPTTPFQDLVLLSQAPHRKFASLKVTFSLRVLSFKDYSENLPVT